MRSEPTNPAATDSTANQRLSIRFATLPATPARRNDRSIRLTVARSERLASDDDADDTPGGQMSDTDRAVDPVRVDGSARDRRDRRRVEEAPRHARARDPDREPRRRRSTPTSRRRSATRPRPRGRRSRSPSTGPTFAELLAGKASVAVVIDNQFRPTPSSKLLPPVFDAIEAAGITDVRVVLREREGLPDVRVGHGAEARPRRTSRGWSANGWAFHQNDPQNPDAYTFVGVSSGGTPGLAATTRSRRPTSRSRSARRRRTTGARAAAAS